MVFEAVFFVGTGFFLLFGFKIAAATPDKSLGAVGRLLSAGLVDTMPVCDEKELFREHVLIWTKLGMWLTNLDKG